MCLGWLDSIFCPTPGNWSDDYSARTGSLGHQGDSLRRTHRLRDAPLSGPKPAGWRDYRYGKDVSEGSVLSGDNLKVIYSLCSTAYRGCS